MKAIYVFTPNHPHYTCKRKRTYTLLQQIKPYPYTTKSYRPLSYRHIILYILHSKERSHEPYAHHSSTQYSFVISTATTNPNVPAITAPTIAPTTTSSLPPDMDTPLSSPFWSRHQRSTPTILMMRAQQAKTTESGLPTVRKPKVGEGFGAWLMMVSWAVTTESMPKTMAVRW